jgi:PAS domain-containing protein
LREERRLRVFENRVLRRIFGRRRDDVTGEWRKLHNEELNDLYSSTNIVRVIKSRRMRWAGHVARMEKRRGETYTWFWCGSLKETYYLGDPELE